MSVFHHILISTCYTLVAAAVAIALPYGFPAVDMNAAIVLGGVVLIGSALLHEVFTRQDGEGKLADDIQMLQLEQGDLRRELDQSRTRMRNLQRALEQVMEEHKTIAGQNRNVDSVIAEVKVLQTLIEQLSAGAAGKAASGSGDDSRWAMPSLVAGRRPIPASGHDPHFVSPDGGVSSSSLDIGDDEILKLVRDGLEGNRVDLVLQPIVSLPQRRLKFYEAFTRIRDDKGGIMTPEQYIAIAEREGLITAIDNMLLFRCVQLVRRAQQRKHNIGFFCNISAHSLTDRHFFNNFIEFMADNVGLARDLIFEFAQSTIANRDTEVEAHLRHLASMGFRFSMDQVQSVHLDFNDLVRNHIKYVKIDADVLLNEVHNPTAPIAIEDIKRMVDRHGIDLVVEKIEAEPTLLELLDFRIDFGQGYLFGEPRLSRIE